MNPKINLVLLAGALLLAACQTAVSATEVEHFVTNQETGLFADLEVGAEQIATLPEGTQLIPADGQATLFCGTLEEAGMAFDLCKVEVLDTGEVGWVLPFLIDQQ